jgi:hypothetical protein
MRQVLLLVGFLALVVPTLAAPSTAEPAELPPLNEAVLKYTESKVGKRVGGGECSHLINEALRVAGAEFTEAGADGKRIPDSPETGDYVWGTHIKTYTYDAKTKKEADSDPKAKCLPGDILQFRDAKTANGFEFPHHTAIVRTVDDAGNPTAIYQQNAQIPKGGDPRVVHKTGLQILKLTSGRIMAYRPEKPMNPSPSQFTLTNNSKSKTVEYTYFGKKNMLGATNTSNGYIVIWGRGKGANMLSVDGMDYTLEPRTAYEFYTTDDGKIALREVK